MIAPQELKQNNLIRDIESGRIGAVLTIGEKKCTIKMPYSKLSQSYEEFEPIELTEEWLLKFGFKEFKDGIYQFWSKDVGLFQIMVCSDNNGFGIRIWLNGTFGRTIYFIHDFQNLFYSLNGVELKIKES